MDENRLPKGRRTLLGAPPPEAASGRELILASASSTRRELLAALGLPFRTVRPDFVETRPPSLAPADLAETLALGKASTVGKRFPEALVLAADQVLVIQGEIAEKPADEAAARAQLTRLRGKAHVLITGVALVVGSHVLRVEHEATRLTLRDFTDEELSRYLATGEWKGCLGSYRVEGQGLKLFSRLEGDLFNARGLPLLRVVNALHELGFPLF